MKQILLTEEHKEKILEMCSLFYGEYSDFKFGNKFFSYEVQFYHTKTNEPSEIYWFEFCMTHLINKLDTKLPFIGSVQPYNVELILAVENGTHPVDYLYEHFKTL